MPDRKIRKARTTMNQLLGSLRHISIAPRPVYWIAISKDLRLFQLVLNQKNLLQGVLFEHFDQSPTVDQHVFVDASDVGFCALDPATQEYIRHLY